MSTSANPHSHLTAKDRAAPSLPVRWLHGRGLLRGSVLDYGCGYGRDVAFLREKGLDATGYDPTYFPELPTRKFDTVLCFYVLNVLLPAEQTDVLLNVSRLLKPTGRAYFAVRRDIARDGFRTHVLHGQRVYQCAVSLPFRSLYRNENTEFYEYQPLTQHPHPPGACPLCAPDAAHYLLTETAHTYAVLAPKPEAEGHTLVVPKHHAATFVELPETAQADARRATLFVRQMLTRRFAPADFTIEARPASDPAGHGCIHILPTYADAR